MIGGTIALLEAAVGEPLESQGTGGFSTLDVRATQQYLDDSTVQRGRVCAHVESRTDEIHTDGTTIEVEQVGATDRVWTDWVADVVDGGFVAAERTAGSDPPFPFDVFRATLETPVDPVEIDTAAFTEARPDGTTLWMSGSKGETADDHRPNDVTMSYGPSANQTGNNVGVGFETPWQGTTARGVVYASGYCAIFNETWGAVKFARFVREAVLPHATVPDDESGAQSTLTGGVCEECGRETEDLDDGLCPVCQSAVEEGVV